MAIVASAPAALAEGNTATKASEGCDLSNPEFLGFLLRVRAFYKHGVFEFGDAEVVSRFLQARETLLLVCPAAVLQALLVKLEENMVYEARAYEELMAEYARYLNHAVRAKTIGPRDMEAWPLSEGIERVLSISRALSEPADKVELQPKPPSVPKLTSAMVMNFCQARDRFGELHELRWLLEPPFGDPAATTDTASGAGETGLLQHTDLFIYLVDNPWCTRPSETVVQQLESAFRKVHLIPYVGGPEREEQTAYFKFLADHYDNLPDFTIFVHPDAPEHQGANFPALRRALRLIHTGSAFARSAIGYYPLAMQMVIDPKRAWGVRFAASWRRFWARLYREPWNEYGFRPPRCRWEAHKGVYIAGLVEGAEERQSRSGAKAACAEHDDCMGVTCGTPPDAEFEQATDVPPEHPVAASRFLSCTARRGDPAGLLQSPVGQQEVSYVKNCPSDRLATAHDDGLAGQINAEEEADDGVEQQESARQEMIRYQRFTNSYLADYAADDAVERSVAASKARCEELGSLCGGITCDDAGESRCSVRAGGQPLESPVGEVSYVKEAVSVSGAGVPAPLGPAAAGASALFQMYTGSQSIVHKERIRAWPRDSFRDLGADGAFCAEFSGQFEAIWHAMFGEPLSQWPRERDPSLPLYLKWAVPTMFSYGDEGVI